MKIFLIRYFDTASRYNSFESAVINADTEVEALAIFRRHYPDGEFQSIVSV